MTSQSVAHVLMAVGVLEWLDLGVDLPLIVHQSGDVMSGLQSPRAVDTSGGPGDLRLSGRVQLIDVFVGPADRLSLAGAIDLGLPTGDRERFQSDGLTLGPRLAAEWQTSFRIRLLGHVGYRWRERSIGVVGVDFKNRLEWGSGIEIPLVMNLGPVDRVSAIGEVVSHVSEEVLGGIKAEFAGLRLLAALGAGVGNDDLAPDWRMTFGLSFDTGRPEADATARAQDLRVDRDDPDGDGVVAGADRCPREPEDKDGFEDEDGCPDDDNDLDSVMDAQDHCPMTPEDIDGFMDRDGCPDEDNDNDGVTDLVDKCPTTYEDRDGFQDGDGCPDPDNDGDGIADVVDRCPLHAEDIDGRDDHDGCPDLGPFATLDGVVFFEPDSTELAERFTYALDRVAATLNGLAPDVHVWIEGHADETAGAEHNLELSKRRATAVRDYLIKHGVPTSRITVVGYGESRRVRKASDDNAKATNRRVEFRVATKVKTPEAQSETAPVKGDEVTP